jgi:hypothetical protein
MLSRAEPGSEATRGQRAGDVRSRGRKKGRAGLESGVLRRKRAAGDAITHYCNCSWLRKALLCGRIRSGRGKRPAMWRVLLKDDRHQYPSGR